MENDLQWNGEMILADVLDNVLKSLTARDLCRAAQVCKSWYHTVKLEFSRRGPERILIPTNPSNPTLEDSEFRLANILSTKPEVVILFCGPRPHLRSKLDLEVDILSAYNNRFPAGTKLIIVGVHKALKDATEILSCPEPFNRAFDASDNCSILGLVLPNYRNVKIDVAYCQSNECDSSDLAKLLAKKMTPEITDQKSILIVFGRSQYSVSQKFLNIIKRTWKSQNYTLWGSTTQDYLKVINCGDGDFPSYLGMQGVICIRITGQGLEAHTILLSCALESVVIRDKLIEFKNKLKLRRHKLGLVCGSGMWVNPDKLMELIKKIFPDISFTSFFNDSAQYSWFDSTSDSPNQEIVSLLSMSMMILTYD